MIKSAWNGYFIFDKSLKTEPRLFYNCVTRRGFNNSSVTRYKGLHDNKLLGNIKSRYSKGQDSIKIKLGY